MEDQELAQAVKNYYGTNPSHTVDDVAEQLGETHARVAQIIDEWHVGDDGTVEHLGPGQGHGWIDEAVRVTLVEGGDAQFAGWRWPDGELRDTPFDPSNDEHLNQMGLVRKVEE